MATYKLDEFEQACADPRKVKVINPALKTAPEDFGLATESEILGFIANGGLEKPEFANTEVWKNNPAPEQPVWVDSYNFYSGQDYGYIAFMKAVTGRWILKSMKRNDKASPRAFLLADKLKKAGLVK